MKEHILTFPETTSTSLNIVSLPGAERTKVVVFGDTRRKVQMEDGVNRGGGNVICPPRHSNTVPPDPTAIGIPFAAAKRAANRDCGLTKTMLNVFRSLAECAHVLNAGLWVVVDGCAVPGFGAVFVVVIVSSTPV